jgi:hypothetical protein
MNEKPSEDIWALCAYIIGGLSVVIFIFGEFNKILKSPMKLPMLWVSILVGILIIIIGLLMVRKRWIKNN